MHLTRRVMQYRSETPSEGSLQTPAKCLTWRMGCHVCDGAQGRGIKCEMVTGDNWRTARSVAGKLGLAAVHAEVLPAGKSSKVRFCWKERSGLCF